MVMLINVVNVHQNESLYEYKERNGYWTWWEICAYHADIIDFPKGNKNESKWKFYSP